MRQVRFMAVHPMLSKVPLAALVAAALVCGAVVWLPAGAAVPPTTINYQGVLRDQNDAPIANSSIDMVFAFMDDPTAGSEIMLDRHTAATGYVVIVTNGLFNVALGGGNVADGSGPGTYTSLDAVFGDYPSVWLEVRVGAETLSPRTKVH